MRTLIAVALAALGMTLTSTAAADVIVLTNGQKLEGRAEQIEGKADHVRFVRGSGSLDIARSKIKEIIEEPDDVDYRRLGNQLLDSRTWARAAEQFERSLAVNPSDAESKAGLAKAKAAVAAEANESAKTEAAQVDVRIEEARTLIKAEKFEEAEKTLKSVAASAPNDKQRTAAQLALVELHSAWGFQRLDRLDAKGAESHYMRVLEMDPDNADAREKLLEVWKDDPTKREAVLTAFQAKLRTDPDNLEFNAKVADLLLALNRYEEALGPLEKLNASAKYRALKYDARLRTTLREVVRSNRDAGNYDASIRYTEKLLALFPEEDPTQLTILRYRKAVALADPKDASARANLIKGLRDAGLVDLAQSEAAVAIKAAPDNPVLKGILREEAEARLNEVRETLNSNDFLVARDQARAFVDRYPQYPELVAKAAEMYERATVESERQKKAAREQAREIAQRGLDYLQQAYSLADQLRNTERASSTRPFSPKQEAIKFARRAVDTLTTALSIDPTLGPVTGMDLTARLGDANELLSSLTQEGTPLPRYGHVPGSAVTDKRSIP